ncbi:MAG: MBL fold metallo-hydrolase [Oscillospiraceae bacterium]|nr:MBL fold metallo-hydrolase [Oscillospiraceae bacterium]
MKRKKIKVSIFGFSVLFFVLFCAFASLYTFWKSPFGFFGCEVESDSCDVLRVHFLSVGSADSIVIEFSKKGCSSCYALVDAGDIGSHEVCDYLYKLNVKKINYAFLTHPHRDHLGQFPEVLGSFQVDMFVTNKNATNFEKYGITSKKLWEIVKEKGIPFKFVMSGARFLLGEVEIFVLGPVFDYGDAEKNLNDSSLVLSVRFKNRAFLLTGDATSKSERDLIENCKDCLQADLLKLGHHGGGGSTSSKFLRHVSPSVAVLCAGNQESVAKKGYLRALKYGVPVYKTCDGNVVVTTDGVSPLTIKTERASLRGAA